MTPTKILFGQIAVSCLLLVLMVWVATQWTAAALNYNARLGAPWMIVQGEPLYPPYKFLIWAVQFDAYAPAIFFKGTLIAGSGGLLSCLAAIAGSVLRARAPKEVTTYGSAKWATPHQIRKAGLFKKDGVILGQYEGKFLRHAGPEHVLAFAPTRSGKGVGLVLPTLLSWTGSAIIHDIKGENWQMSAGFRHQFSTCYCFDPTNPDGAKYNPLAEIRLGQKEVRDVQNVIEMMINPHGLFDKPTHWDKTAKDLMIAVILHVLYVEADKTMSGLARFLSDPGRTKEETLELLRTTFHLGDRPHEVVAHGARQAQNMTEKEYSGVLSTAMSALGLYRDPVVAEVTSASDFTIEGIINGHEPLSLYLVIPPSDIVRTRPLIRLLLTQILQRLTEDLHHAVTAKHKLLLLLDEFPMLGNLEAFESALAFIGGYKIKAVLIAQSLNQIDKFYGPNNAILDNCQVKVTFAANDDRTARRITELLGTCTEQRHQRNFSGHRLAAWLGHMSVATQETSRSLLTQGEVLQLPQEQALVMIAGVPPIRAMKVKYYLDRTLKTRQENSPPSLVATPPPKASAVLGGEIKGLPFIMQEPYDTRELGLRPNLGGCLGE